MGGGQGVEDETAAGSVLTEAVSEQGDLGGLVDGDPHGHPVGEPLRHHRGVLREPLGGVPVEPAAPLLQGERGVPVEERGHRGDPRGAQLVDEPVVEVQSLVVDPAVPFGQDAGPGDREPVGADAEFGHQRHVLAVAPVVVGGHLGVGAVLDASPLSGEGVPGGGTAAVGRERALDLEGGGGDSPEEAGRELGYGRCHGDSLRSAGAGCSRHFRVPGSTLSMESEQFSAFSGAAAGRRAGTRPARTWTQGSAGTSRRPAAATEQPHPRSEESG